MIVLQDMVTFLDGVFQTEQYPDEAGGVFAPSARGVRRLGLALEPWPGLADWAQTERLDALFLHRPWKLQQGELPDDIGIMAHHLAFDEHLTLGFNVRLAAALRMEGLQVLGDKGGRPLGMLGDVPPQSFEAWRQQCEQVFGGLEDVIAGGPEEITTIAVVGAMNDALVREAAQRGAGLYVTGQLRQPGLAAVRETGVGVLAVGHRRSEQWGLRALAGVLRERWHNVVVIVSSET